MWSKRVIENYITTRASLLLWAQQAAIEYGGPLFADKWQEIMEQAIEEVERAMATLGKGSPWAPDTKVSDDFLSPVFAEFFRRLNLPNLMKKSDYHVLAHSIPTEDVDPEVGSVLDEIVITSGRARPRTQ